MRRIVANTDCLRGRLSCTIIVPASPALRKPRFYGVLSCLCLTLDVFKSQSRGCRDLNTECAQKLAAGTWECSQELPRPHTGTVRPLSVIASRAWCPYLTLDCSPIARGWRETEYCGIGCELHVRLRPGCRDVSSVVRCVRAWARERERTGRRERARARERRPEIVLTRVYILIINI